MVLEPDPLVNPMNLLDDPLPEGSVSGGSVEHQLEELEKEMN